MLLLGRALFLDTLPLEPAAASTSDSAAMRAFFARARVAIHPRAYCGSVIQDLQLYGECCWVVRTGVTREALKD